MSRKHLTIIVAMSLALVLIIAQTLILASFSNNNRQKDNSPDLVLEVPSNEPIAPTPGPILDQEEIERQIEEIAREIEGDADSGVDPEELPAEPIEEPNIPPQEANLSPNTQTNQSPAPVAPTAPKENKQLNKQTKNTNILCLGIADKELEMISVYSINKDNKKSAGIFLPTRTSLRINGELLTLADIYRKYGILTLKKAISQSLLVDIPYHMVADKQGLVELSELLGPLYVENEEIDIPNLFVRPVTEKDDEILQSLAQQVSQPRMVLQVPRLIRIFINNVQSDIGVNGLWELYQVFSKLNHSELGKVVLWGERVTMADRVYWFIDPYDWHNVIYEMTK